MIKMKITDLINAKNKLLAACPNLEVISTMDSSDCVDFKIK